MFEQDRVQRCAKVNVEEIKWNLQCPASTRIYLYAGDADICHFSTPTTSALLCKWHYGGALVLELRYRVSEQLKRSENEYFQAVLCRRIDVNFSIDFMRKFYLGVFETWELCRLCAFIVDICQKLVLRSVKIVINASSRL